MDPASALADLIEISSQVDAAVVLDAEGSVLASTLDDAARSERLGRAGAALLAAGDESPATGARTLVPSVANIGERHGGMMTAAVFLQEFVGKDKAGAEIPWAHIDIAGPAYHSGGPYGYIGKGGTGVPVRTIAAVLADIAANG